MSSATHIESQPAVCHANQCVAVSASALRYLDEIDFDLYTLNGPQGSPLLFCRQGLDEFTAKLRALGGRCPQSLYVTPGNIAKYRARLRHNLPTLLVEDAIAPGERFQVLRSAVGEMIERSYRLINVAEAVRHSQEVGEHVARVLTSSRLSPQSLFQFVEHDYSTFTHLLNVASYAVLLAQSLGIHDAAQLEDIATGGMLHDVGKRMLPKHILNKPGPLTRAERETVRTHSQVGYETLVRRNDLTFAQLMMVYQHHERWDGSGYPVRLVGGEIHPMARLTAVVDVFDALTGERPYRKTMRTSLALHCLMEQAGRHFDAEMVACWTAAFST